MALIEFQMDGGKIKAIPTKEEYVPSKLDELAAAAAEEQRKRLEERWDARRAAFFNWALANPNELDMLLDEVERYGVLLPFEYGAPEHLHDIRDMEVKHAED